MNQPYCNFACAYIQRLVYETIDNGPFVLSSYAESVGAKHYYTSAKQNKGVGELFLDLAKSRL